MSSEGDVKVSETTSIEASMTNRPPRRPRVREVSSRFMSPQVIPSSSSFSPTRQQQRSVSTQRHRRRLDLDTEPISRSSDDIASETPSRYLSQSTKFSVVQQRRPKSSDSSSRIDTPNVAPPSRMRIGTLNSKSVASSLLRSSVMRSSSSFSSTDETLESDSASIASTSDSETSSLLPSNTNSPNRVNNKSKTRRMLTELRSSTSDSDKLATKFAPEKNSENDSLRFWDSPCSRSMNLPLTSCENSSQYHSMKPGEKMVNLGKSLDMQAAPPKPPRSKIGTKDANKGKAVLSNQENLHSLRMLHNRYLQWRFINAKANVCMQAQKDNAEKTFYSLGESVSNLRDSVLKKRMEVERLRRVNSLCAILEAQIPILDEWSALEGEYSFSLSETIQALMNALVQLPIGGNVKADARELDESLNSALKTMEMIASNVQRFNPKAEELEKMISELARVFGGEINLVENCGEVLSKTCILQVKECSLRSQLIQLQQTTPSI